MAVQNEENFVSPKSSAGEIIIITPENKTYTAPMSGYYPATYSYEDIPNGQDHPEWNDLSSQKGSIVSEMDGHKKVYEAIDNSGSGAVDLLEYYDIQSYGSVEFWCRFTSATEGHFYRLRKEGPLTLGPFFGVDQGKFRVVNSTESFDVPNAPLPQIYTWYHIRFDFRGSYLSEYLGLTDQYTYFLYIDMVKYGPYTYQESYDVGTFHVHTGIAGSGFTIWWDAVGYSWDINYNIGDNLNEGLLLSYDNSTSLDWQGYSLDSQANKTVLGSTTIPMPADGLHKIQVFGNDTMGAMFESDLRYFSVNTAPPEITINSPTPSQVVGSTVPSYDLSITGLYDSIWYTLDGGATNRTMNSLTGTLDQTAWTALSDGIITIDFYANNSAGMEDTAQVQVIKDSSEEPPPTPPGIPGYDLYLLIGALSIISTIIIRKRVKS
jgi:hypothetical protein